MIFKTKIQNKKNIINKYISRVRWPWQPMLVRLSLMMRLSSRTVPNDINNAKIFMVSLRFSLRYFSFLIFPRNYIFLKILFFVYFLSFLFNFVSMDYSPYVIKASDGSFKKAHVNMFRSRDDSTDCPCVFDLFRISEIMWILHKKTFFMTS